jgi:hypothetical protein
VPPFSYPNAIALLSSTRARGWSPTWSGIDPADVAIGLRVRVEFTRRRRAGVPLFRPDPY